MSVRVGSLAIVLFLLGVVPTAFAQGMFQLVTDPRFDSGYATDVNWVTMSDDGLVVAFDAYRRDASGSVTGVLEVMVWTRATGEIGVASLGTGGQPANGASSHPVLSPDGSFVVFLSAASNLVSDDTNGRVDLFIRELSTGITTRITPDLPADSYITYHAVSAGARVVAISVGGFGEWWRERPQHIYVIDRVTGVSSRMEFLRDPLDRFGTFVNDITPDGRYVVFSTASPLTDGDLPEDDLPPSEVRDSDVFVLDRASGKLERVSIATSGAEGQGSSAFGRISDDGRYIAFWSEAAHLAPGDVLFGYGSSDIYLRDREAGTTTRVSADRSGLEPNSQAGNRPAISANGNVVVYQSQPVFYDGTSDLFVYNRRLATTERISVDPNSNENDFLFPTVSGDGRVVAFRTAAALVPQDVDATEADRGKDVYVYDRGPQGGADSILQALLQMLDGSSGWRAGLRAKLQAVLAASGRGNSAAACGPLKAAMNQAVSRDVAVAAELRKLGAGLGCASAKGQKTMGR